VHSAPASKVENPGGKPRVLFINTNGAGMGHLNRCLAYARALEGQAEPIFLTLSSAVEIIEQFGFEADYFVSHFWAASSSRAWNRELAHRLGQILDTARPSVMVFDGSNAFAGLVEACAARNDLIKIWSRRGGNKDSAAIVPIDTRFWDQVLEPGEIAADDGGPEVLDGCRRVPLPPVTLLQPDEILTKEAARRELGMSLDERYALLSMGSGNQKDTRALAQSMVNALNAKGLSPVWAQAPISVRAPSLPRGVETLRLYPLARYMKAFDFFVGAAGYNTCCELIQSGIPALLVPNRKLKTDDQAARARHLQQFLPVVVSDCRDDAEIHEAVNTLLALRPTSDASSDHCRLDGAMRGAETILGALGEHHGR